MNRIVRFHNIIQTQRLHLQRILDPLFKGCSLRQGRFLQRFPDQETYTIQMFKFYFPQLHVLLEYLLYCNVGHHFKLINSSRV